MGMARGFFTVREAVIVGGAIAVEIEIMAETKARGVLYAIHFIENKTTHRVSEFIFPSLVNMPLIAERLTQLDGVQMRRQAVANHVNGELFPAPQDVRLFPMTAYSFNWRAVLLWAKSHWSKPNPSISKANCDWDAEIEQAEDLEAINKWLKDRAAEVTDGQRRIAQISREILEELAE